MITFLGMGENLAEGSLETADFDGMYTGCDYDAGLHTIGTDGEVKTVERLSQKTLQETVQTGKCFI